MQILSPRIITPAFALKIIHCLKTNVTCVIIPAFVKYVQEQISVTNVNLHLKLIMEAVCAPNPPPYSIPSVYPATYQTANYVRKQTSVKLAPISILK